MPRTVLSTLPCYKSQAKYAKSNPCGSKPVAVASARHQSVAGWTILRTMPTPNLHERPLPQNMRTRSWNLQVFSQAQLLPTPAPFTPTTRQHDTISSDNFPFRPNLCNALTTPFTTPKDSPSCIPINVTFLTSSPGHKNIHAGRLDTPFLSGSGCS